MSYQGVNKVWLASDRSAYLEWDPATSKVNVVVGGTTVSSYNATGVGYFGATPVAQQTMTLTATTAIGTTTISAANTSAVWGFASSTAANALVTRVTQLQANFETLTTKLENLGLFSISGN